MKKSINTTGEKMEKIAENLFPKGFRFFLHGKEWYVVSKEEGDSAPMRKIVSSDGVEEIVLLSSLRNDMLNSDDYKEIK